MDMLTALVVDGLGGAVVTVLAKAVGRVAGRRRARVQALLDRFGRLSSDLRTLALLVLVFLAAAGAGIAFGFGPAFITLGLLLILMIAALLCGRLCRLVAERMQEDGREPDEEG